MVDPQHYPIEQLQASDSGHGVTAVMACGHRAWGHTLPSVTPRVCARGGQGGDLKHSAAAFLRLSFSLLAVLSTRRSCTPEHEALTWQPGVWPSLLMGRPAPQRILGTAGVGTWAQEGAVGE